MTTTHAPRVVAFRQATPTGQLSAYRWICDTCNRKGRTTVDHNHALIGRRHHEVNG